MRAVASHDPGSQVGDNGRAVRRLPPLATIERRRRAQAQVLNDDVLVTLVARAVRRLRLDDDRLAYRQLVQLAPASTRRARALLPVGPRSGAALRRLVHPGSRDRRPRRQILQPREFILDDLMLGAKLGQRDLQCLVLGAKRAHHSDKIAHKADQLRGGQMFDRISRVADHRSRKNHTFLTLTPPAPNLFIAAAREFAPVTETVSKLLFPLIVPWWF